MTSAKEVFVMQLSRASRKANRFIRRLPKEAREDVTATAILWCWENRDSYSLVVPLDVWFVGAVRHAYRDWLRGERRNRAELVSEMRSNDDPEYNTQLAQAVDTLINNMDEIDRAIVDRLLEGRTQREVAYSLEIGHATVERRLQRMRSFIPAGAHHGVILRRVITGGGEGGLIQSAIDVALRELDLPPKKGKDCPPCWRCKWFEGYLPGDRKDVRMEVVEADVKAAIANTEAEKIRIAKEVRDGYL